MSQGLRFLELLEATRWDLPAKIFTYDRCAVVDTRHSCPRLTRRFLSLRVRSLPCQCTLWRLCADRGDNAALSRDVPRSRICFQDDPRILQLPCPTPSNTTVCFLPDASQERRRTLTLPPNHPSQIHESTILQTVLENLYPPNTIPTHPQNTSLTHHYPGPWFS